MTGEFLYRMTTREIPSNGLIEVQIALNLLCAHQYFTAYITPGILRNSDITEIPGYFFSRDREFISTSKSELKTFEELYGRIRRLIPPEDIGVGYTYDIRVEDNMAKEALVYNDKDLFLGRFQRAYGADEVTKEWF